MNQKEQERCIETVLQMDGIMAKGYGMVAKFPMRDTALKIKDKAIYAYLCALSGGGVKTWPSRSKILADLQIGKSAFYNSMDRLIKEGYLSKTNRRIHGERGLWTKTIYTIELNPKRYQDSQIGTTETDGEHSSLSVEGMLNDGWGFAPRLVMQDSRLSIRTKALYAYIMTYAAAGRVAYPKVSTITFHLGISEKSYREMMKQLCSLGYIIRHRRRNTNGRLGGYDYYISPKLTISEKTTAILDNTGGKENSEPSGPNPDTVEEGISDLIEADDYKMYTDGNQDKSNPPEPPGSNPDTVENRITPPGPNPDTVKPDTVKPPTAEPDTANRVVRKLQESSITSLSITKEENYQPSITTSHSVQKSVESEEQLLLMQQVLIAGGIPLEYLGDRNKVTAALRYLCGLDWRKEKAVADRYLDETKQEAFKVVMKAMLRLCTQKVTKIGDLILRRDQIVEKLNRCCEKGKLFVSLDDFIEVAVSDYVQAIQSREDEGKTPVRTPVNYACYVIWSATDTYQHMKWLEAEENCLLY